MIFTETELKGAFIVKPEPHRDKRGLFMRTFCKKEFREIGHLKEFVQFNHSITEKKGTIRGMHFQYPPSAEIRLIRCIRGEVYDVIVDLRKNSSTYLKHISINLSEENRMMIYIPEGFAHGFQTLQHNTQLVYYHTSYYSPPDLGGLLYCDPVIGIKWPLESVNLSDRDQNNPTIDENFKVFDF